MQRRILIAEDEFEVKELLSLVATRFGYHVTTVKDGVELLTIAANEKFDVILTDIKMPNLTGASASEIMKLQGNTTPIIAMTALSPRDLDLVLHKFTRIFYKPYDVKELFKYIESLIS